MGLKLALRVISPKRMKIKLGKLCLTAYFHDISEKCKKKSVSVHSLTRNCVFVIQYVSVYQ